MVLIYLAVMTVHPFISRASREIIQKHNITIRYFTFSSLALRARCYPRGGKKRNEDGLSYLALRARCYIFEPRLQAIKNLSSLALRARCYVLLIPLPRTHTTFISRATREMLYRFINNP